MVQQTTHLARRIVEVNGTGRISAGIAASVPTLDALGTLPGTWTGTGFNVIWRPLHSPDSDHFLQLNLTQETLAINSIGGPVPNRGLVQDDITLTGVRYLQQIHDGSGFTPPTGGGALHIEPGFWLSVPPTTEPPADASIVRLGSIPHGNAVLAAGSSVENDGPPVIAPAPITPFVIGHPDQTVHFDTSNLAIPSDVRSAPLPDGITQELVDDPNKLLTDRLACQSVVHTTTIDVSTDGSSAGLENIAFLAPNADAVDLTSTFWIETVQEADGSTFLQLQYTQSLLLNFAGLSWPHISVANLILTGA
jgi:hypothetical protein